MPAIIEGEVLDSTEVTQVAERAIARSGATDMDASLAVQLTAAEVDQQIATARKWPRSIDKAVQAIVSLATYDPETAAECLYQLPRGKGANAKTIEGPSIRMAELIAQQWGNNRCDARVVHVDKREKYIEAEGVYHDLETNTAVRSKVRRRISDSRGGLYNDDMIIVTGNAACSIALRNAILRGVPKPIWRQAYEKAKAVVRGDERTLATRRGQLVAAFEALSVKPEQMFALIGVRGMNDIDLDRLVELSGIYSALKNNEVTVEDLIAERRAMQPAQSPRGLASGFGDAGAPATTGGRTATRAKPAQAAADPEPGTEPHDPVTGEVDAAEGQGAAGTAETDAGEAQGGQVEDEDETPTTAPAGETYLIIGEGYGENGRRTTYQDGKPFSAVTEKGAAKLTAYDNHAPEVEAADDGVDQAVTGDDQVEGSGDEGKDATNDTDPTTQSQPSSDDSRTGDLLGDAGGSGAVAGGDAFAGFEGQLDDAGSWAFVTEALKALSQDPAWTGAEDEARRMARRAAYERYDDLVAAGDQDPITLTDDLQLFRCWLERDELTGPELQKAWRDVIRSGAYGGLDEASRDGLGRAVATRKAAFG